MSRLWWLDRTYIQDLVLFFTESEREMFTRASIVIFNELNFLPNFFIHKNYEKCGDLFSLEKEMNFNWIRHKWDRNFPFWCFCRLSHVGVFSSSTAKPYYEIFRSLKLKLISGNYFFWNKNRNKWTDE